MAKTKPKTEWIQLDSQGGAGKGANRIRIVKRGAEHTYEPQSEEEHAALVKRAKATLAVYERDGRADEFQVFEEREIPPEPPADTTDTTTDTGGASA
jgi:hypothetical protein